MEFDIFMVFTFRRESLAAIVNIEKKKKYTNNDAERKSEESEAMKEKRR